ncbi:restriction endonuclease subunit S [Streptomyces sp. NPDC090021]|uniref:restriction endonuclease subunit S n=1 Tax=Streptomyces sp. NPDC090021 TaxID=3365919 RepID=UPI00381E6F8A
MAGIYRDIGVPCIYPDLMMRLRTSGRYIPEFLEIVLRAPEARRCIAALAQGTSDSMVKISADVINRMEIPDVPISDQQRFVAGLDAVSTLERGLCSGILKIRNVRSGLLGREFSEGVGGGWPLKEIGNLCEVSSGATPSRAAGSRYFSSSGMPWVKTLDLNEGLISATDETLTEAAISELRMRQFPERSVLVAMYGGWEQIGRTAILGVPAAVNQAIAVLQPLGGLNPDYLLLAMQHMRHQWRRFAASTRKDPNVTKSDVLGFRIPVPPYGDQVRIVQLAAASLQDITAAEQQLNGLRKLKEGLTSELISGQRSFVGGLSK